MEVPEERVAWVGLLRILARRPLLREEDLWGGIAAISPSKRIAAVSGCDPPVSAPERGGGNCGLRCRAHLHKRLPEPGSARWWRCRLPNSSAPVRNSGTTAGTFCSRSSRPPETRASTAASPPHSVAWQEQRLAQGSLGSGSGRQ